MAAQKQSLPSFASILSVLSIVFYCAGFLRVELELNEQRKRINTLESVAAETKPSSHVPDLVKLTKNARELESIELHRNRRPAYSVKNTTEAKSTPDTVAILKINKLLSELKPRLCHTKEDTCPPGPPGPPGPRGEKGSRGRRGQKGRTGNKGDGGVMGSPGVSGKQGIMGPVGLKGEAGIRGQKGDLGPAGMPGDRGIMGEKGSRGRRGKKGRTGNKGDRGIKGSPGKSGKQSVMGPVGLKEEAGIKGQKGDLGPAGMPGDRGIMGSPGKSGKQGIIVPVGLKGEAGIKGQKRNLGPTGMPGAKGEPCLHGLAASNILDSLNSKYRAKLNSYLDPVLQSPGRSRFVRCWHAKTDGWAASTFHSNCDGKGPTVTIVRVGSYIFGGYTDKSWGGSCRYVSSRKSFVFSLYNINGYAPVKLKVKSSRYRDAIYTCSRYGPQFGAPELQISNNAASNQQSRTYCGYAYHLPPGYSASGRCCRFYAGGQSYKFTPSDIEVFYETTT